MFFRFEHGTIFNMLDVDELLGEVIISSHHVDAFICELNWEAPGRKVKVISVLSEWPNLVVSLGGFKIVEVELVLANEGDKEVFVPAIFLIEELLIADGGELFSVLHITPLIDNMRQILVILDKHTVLPLLVVAPITLDH